MKKLIILITVILMTATTFAQKPENNISPEFPFQLKSITVNDIQLKYYEQGNGEPVLFLHGIPSNSYLWRNVVPIVAKNSRAIALDLAGYGQSDLPRNQDYTFQSQYAYLKGFIDSLKLTHITLVVNDLGSTLGIKYAIENEQNVKTLVMLESAFMPAKEWYKQLTFMQKMMFSIFAKFQGMAERMIVTKNKMPKMVMKMGIVRKLSDLEMQFYQAPYLHNIEKRKVYFKGPGPANFPRKGVSKVKGDFADVLDQNAKGLLNFSKPMLLLHANPGLITKQTALNYAKTYFKNCILVNIGKGKHFLPEDHPTKIGEEINKFITKNKLNN